MISAFHQGSWRTALEPVPNLEKVLLVLMAYEPVLQQEYWFECGTNTSVLEPRIADFRVWGWDYHDQQGQCEKTASVASDSHLAASSAWVANCAWGPVALA